MAYEPEVIQGHQLYATAACNTLRTVRRLTLVPPKVPFFAATYLSTQHRQYAHWKDRQALVNTVLKVSQHF
ncbi:uncharacterized protein N7483_007313 [Penicillium malachiteum]|uniref:uncharacterized protein n=1 Tax=Penicillium malachiteum TaxID=1324776 RepID=UPI0025474AE3|nr:uncharacterized protein N7483_007313 [Penicillium malachiteum]KAJ5725956.1 hypothetical protein N7483_007313 [Penicillium malachiteum]